MSEAELPLRCTLRRFADREARVWLQRWKGDHPVTVSLSLAEFRHLVALSPIVEQQIEVAPNAGGAGGSTLDLDALLGPPKESAA